MKRYWFLLLLSLVMGCDDVHHRVEEREEAVVVATHYSYDGGGYGMTTSGSLAFTIGNGAQYSATVEFSDGKRDIVDVWKDTFINIQPGSILWRSCTITYRIDDNGYVYQSGRVCDYRWKH